ncbi:MAG: type II secretion system F family protein [Candidatus Bathyarchaeota archaeon]
MKITKRNLKQITIISAICAVAIFIAALPIYLLSPDLDYILVIAFTVGVLPPGIASIIHNRWQNKIEKATPEFLRDISTSFKTGMTLYTALEHAARRDYGPLTDELKIMLSQMSWGMNFNDALVALSKRIDLPLMYKATTLIIEAGKHGGDLSDIFDSTAKYVDNVNAWTNKRRTQTLPYVAIFYFSVVIFLFIIILISNMIFVTMAEMAGDAAGLIKPVLTPTTARRVFLHTALLEAFFGGILAGRIHENSFYGGLKHAAVLAIISGLAFFIFFK